MQHSLAIVEVRTERAENALVHTTVRFRHPRATCGVARASGLYRDRHGMPMPNSVSTLQTLPSRCRLR